MDHLGKHFIKSSAVPMLCDLTYSVMRVLGVQWKNWACSFKCGPTLSDTCELNTQGQILMLGEQY